MNVTKIQAADIASLLALTASAAAPQVSNVTMTQDQASGSVFGRLSASANNGRRRR